MESVAPLELEKLRDMAKSGTVDLRSSNPFRVKYTAGRESLSLVVSQCYQWHWKDGKVDKSRGLVQCLVVDATLETSSRAKQAVLRTKHKTFKLNLEEVDHHESGDGYNVYHTKLDVGTGAIFHYMHGKVKATLEVVSEEGDRAKWPAFLVVLIPNMPVPLEEEVDVAAAVKDVGEPDFPVNDIEHEGLRVLYCGPSKVVFLPNNGRQYTTTLGGNGICLFSNCYGDVYVHTDVSLLAQVTYGDFFKLPLALLTGWNRLPTVCRRDATKVISLMGMEDAKITVHVTPIGGVCGEMTSANAGFLTFDSAGSVSTSLGDTLATTDLQVPFTLPMCSRI